MKEKDAAFKKQFNSFPDFADEYQKMYEAILELETEQKPKGISALGFTKYQILFQMVNEKYKEDKAKAEKDPRKKVWMKLRNWV
jgi:hypothetical protein